MAVPVPGTNDIYTQALIDGEINRLSMPRQAQVVAGAATINIDASKGSHGIVNTGTGALTIAAPTNAKDGQLLTLYMSRTNTGGFLFNSAYRFANGIPPLDTATSSGVNFVTFQYIASGTAWNEIARSTNAAVAIYPFGASPPYVAMGNVSGAITGSGATLLTSARHDSMYSLTATGNLTLAPAQLPSVPSGLRHRVGLRITQDGTGSRTLTLDAAIKTAGGTDPVLSTAAGAIDYLELNYTGVEWTARMVSAAIA